MDAKEKLENIKNGAVKKEEPVKIEKQDLSEFDEMSDAEIDKIINETDFDNLETPDDEDVESDDDEHDVTDEQEDSEDNGEKSEEPKGEEPDKTQQKVPLRKYEEERKKRQEVESKLLAQNIMLKKFQETEAEKAVDAEVTTYKESKRKKYIDAGYEESLANILAEDLAEVYKKSLIVKTSVESEAKIDKNVLAVAELKNSDEFFDNADAYSEKIIEKMKKLDLTAREAYMLVVDPIARQKEIAQRNSASKKDGSGAKTNKSLASSENTKPKDGVSGLSKSHMRVLKELQKDDPEGEWDVGKYKKYVLNQKN